MVIFESSHFEAVRGRYLNDLEYSLLQRQLILDPNGGEVIRGSGGIRKLRWAGRGRGKRGELRVIYYWITADEQILMLDIYSQGEKADLSRAEIKKLREIVKSL